MYCWCEHSGNLAERLRRQNQAMCYLVRKGEGSNPSVVMKGLNTIVLLKFGSPLEISVALRYLGRVTTVEQDVMCRVSNRLKRERTHASGH